MLKETLFKRKFAELHIVKQIKRENEIFFKIWAISKNVFLSYALLIIIYKHKWLNNIRGCTFDNYSRVEIIK